MAPVLRYLQFLLFCGVVVSGHETESDQKRILDFMATLSGSWDNKAQFDASKEHDFIRGYIRQVEMPALPNKYLLFAEQSINDRVAVLVVLDVTVDRNDKDVIRMTPYQFMDITTLKPREYKIENLQNLTRDQLKHRPDCVDNLIRLPNGVYSGNCAICSVTIGGVHPSYAVTLTCDESTGAIPLSAPARAASLPYVFRLNAPKFPLLKAPEGYTSPCDKSGGSSNSTEA